MNKDKTDKKTDQKKKKTPPRVKKEKTPEALDREARSLDLNRTISKMLTKGNTEREISKVTGLSKTAIHHRIQHIKNDPDFIDFKENKADRLEIQQYELLKLVDPEVRKKMLMSRGMTDIGILEDKIRALRGENTGQHVLIVTTIKELQARKAELLNAS